MDGACDKGDGAGGKRMKAKARLVVLGFFDPDAGILNTKSPTMSRRSRQPCHNFPRIVDYLFSKLVQKLLSGKVWLHKANAAYLESLSRS